MAHLTQALWCVSVALVLTRSAAELCTGASAIAAGSLLQKSKQRDMPHAASTQEECFNVTSWYQEFAKQSPWKKYSQGNQDCATASLLAHLGTQNKFFVEFGFNQKGWNKDTSGPNTELLYRDHNFTGVLFDGGFEAPEDNLYKAWVTSDNVVSLFRKHNVPTDVDFVTIDIDSCDVFVFMSLTDEYRPRVLTIEYNSNYAIDESKANVCTASTGEQYVWKRDSAYGASLAAIGKAASKRGYTVAWVEESLDVFLVRDDLVCPGSQLPLETFKPKTALKMWEPLPEEEASKWVVDF